MFKRLLVLFAIAGLAFGVAACGSDSDSDKGSSDSPDVAKVEANTWKLMNIAAGGSATSLPNTIEAPTVEFADGKVNVFTSCNSGSGDAEIGDKTIDFGPIALTKKGCDALSTQVEQYMTLVLDGEAKYSFSQGNMSLTKGQTSLIFTPDTDAG